MTRGVFVTGTDTGIGKTRAALALLAAAARRGLRTAAMKPVASGADRADEGLRHEDALALRQAAGIALAYEEVNPYVFAPPISPHLAAQEAGVLIDLARIRSVFDSVSARADWTVVEGIGGWQVPLSPRHSVADLAGRLALPVVLVVGLRLGCLNHALLTAESIGRHGLMLAGWIANRIDPALSHPQENIEYLTQHLAAPLLGILSYRPIASPQELAASLDLHTLLPR